MSVLTDEELQQLFEQGLTPPAGSLTDGEVEALSAYQLVFEQLGKEPAEGFSYGFSQRVVRLLKMETRPAPGFVWYLMAAFICVAGFGGACGLLNLFDPGAASKIFGLVAGYKGAIVLALIAFLTVQYLDQRFVKGREV